MKKNEIKTLTNNIANRFDKKISVNQVVSFSFQEIVILKRFQKFICNVI